MESVALQNFIFIIHLTRGVNAGGGAGRENIGRINLGGERFSK